jgi:hypothetical protein
VLSSLKKRRYNTHIEQVVHIFTVWYPCSISIKEEEEYLTTRRGGERFSS